MDFFDSSQSQNSPVTPIVAQDVAKEQPTYTTYGGSEIDNATSGGLEPKEIKPVYSKTQQLGRGCSTIHPLSHPITGFAAFHAVVSRAFSPGQKIWLKHGKDRFFCATVAEPGHFDLFATKGKETNRKTIESVGDAFTYLTKEANSRDGGIFYIPGKPNKYPLKDHCQASCDIGAEMDDGSRGEQWERIQVFVETSGLIPGWVINSGGKSQHPHWKLTEDVDIEVRTYLARLVCIALLGDPAVTRPHQPMRMAGFYRKEKQAEQTLEFLSDNTYSVEDFTTGLQKAFASLGLPFPDSICDNRWKRLEKALNKEEGRESKLTEIKTVLSLTDDELNPKPPVRKPLEGKKTQAGGFGISKFIPSSKHLPCPICDDSKGKCRTKEDNGKSFVLCMNVSNSFKGEVVNGYKCINPNGRDAWGSTWVQLLDDEGYNPELAQKRRQQAEKEERRYQQFLKSGLSRGERDKNIRLLSRYLGLSKSHRENLKQRGLSAQVIAEGGFFSVEPNQSIPRSINPKTPGIRFGKVSVGQSGLACPTFDPTGRITGYQNRLDKATEGKYRWAKGERSSHLKNGELPITVTRPVEGKPKSDAIWMAEGVLKPFVAAQSHQRVVFGASGANFSNSSEQLQLYLGQVSGELGTKVIGFCSDAGAVANGHVIRSYRKTFDLLEGWGYEVKIVWWGQFKKGLDKDVDEISSDQPIEYISLEEFEALCIEHGGYISPVKPEASTEELTSEQQEELRKREEYHRKVASAQKPLRTLSYKPDLIFNSKDHPYLPDLVGKVPTNGILLLDCHKGTGKSVQIKGIKDHLCGHWEEEIEISWTTETEIIEGESPPQLNMLVSQKQVTNKIKNETTKRVFHKGLGKDFVSITPRIALGREQAGRWENNWIDDISSDNSNLDSHEKAWLRDIEQIGLCPDSLWKLKNRDFSNHLLVMDECELGLSHMATSNTLKHKRPQTLSVFEEKVRECLENDGLVILADADLTDISVDYIRSICPEAPVFVVTYEGNPRPYEVEFHTGHPDEVQNQIIDWFDKDENPENYDKPIAIATDNRAEAEAIEKQLLQRYPELAGTTNGIIRIDSKFTQTDAGREIVKHINESIEELKPRCLIYTPSLGVGASIVVDWFHTVFGLFFGVIEPSQARQLLGRVRKPIPRIVWAKGNGNVNHGITGSFFPEEIKGNLFRHHETTSELIQLALEMSKKNAENECDAEILPELIKTLQGMMGENGTWNNIHLDLMSKFQARRNFGLSQFALQLRQELIEEGNKVIDCACLEKNQAGDDIREQKVDDKWDKSGAIAEAQDKTPEEIKRLSQKASITEEEENQILKAWLKEELPGVELTPEFVYKAQISDRGRWKNSHKLLWHCQHPEAAKIRDLKEWRYRLKSFEQGVPYLPDIKTGSLQCKAISESGVLDFIKPENLSKEYTSQSPEIRGLLAWGKRNQKLLKNAFGMSLGDEKKPIYFLKRLLGKIGVEIKQSKEEKMPNGSKVRFYQIDSIALTDPDRKTILEAFDRRWQIQQEESRKREQAWLEQKELANQEIKQPKIGQTELPLDCHNPQYDKGQPTTEDVASEQSAQSSPSEGEMERVANLIIKALGLGSDEAVIERLKQIRREVGENIYGLSQGMLKVIDSQSADLLQQLRLRAKICSAMS